jgi:hypothetical protein
MKDSMDMTGSRHVSRIVLIVGVVLALAMVAGSIAFYVIFVKAPSDLARNTADGIRELFNFTPRVKIEQTVVIEQSAPILEVATVSKGIFVDHHWEHTWLGSTKSVEMQASFTVKAGFDLHEPFEITVEKNPLRVYAGLPAPKILSLQMDNYRITRDENGWWNRVSDADREHAVMELQNVARQKAESSGILEEVRSSAEQRIREIVERNGATVAFNPAYRQ